MIKLDEKLSGVKTVGISGHVRPDGDCVGSTLAVYNYISKYYPGISVELYLESIPNVFKFLTNADKIYSCFEDDKQFDLFIILDCGDAGRLGPIAKYYETAKRTLCIDHHVSNQAFADDNYIVMYSDGMYRVDNWSYDITYEDFSIKLITLIDRNTKQTVKTIDLHKMLGNNDYPMSAAYRKGKVILLTESYSQVPF